MNTSGVIYELTCGRLTTYGGSMTTTKAPTELSKSILNCIHLSGITEAAVCDRLGISRNTYKKRLASDGFTVQELLRISEVTGFHISRILPPAITNDLAMTA